MEDDKRSPRCPWKGSLVRNANSLKRYPRISLITLICIERRSESQCRGTTCSRKTAVVATPSNPPTTTTHRLKPAELLVKFTGDRTRGRAFLNSCDLYHWAGPTQFRQMTKQRIYWVPLFYEKATAPAAPFTDRTMRLAQQTGSLPWVDLWADFRLEFIRDFCPERTWRSKRLRTDLETSKYHQGFPVSVDEYVD